MSDVLKRRDVDLVVDSLEAGVGRGGVDHETLAAVVAADFRRFDSARIKDFVPVLVENDIRARILMARAS